MSLVTRYLEPALVERLNQLQLTGRSVVEGSTIGAHRSPMKGASVEFRQHRPYVRGDEPRRLDWRVLARTDRPYVREYDEETNLRCLLLLDASGSMSYGSRGRAGVATKFDYAARLVASLSYLMLGQTESVGFASAGDGLTSYLAPRSGSAQLARIIEGLERLAPTGSSDLRQAIHGSAERLGRRALVVVVSDFLCPVATLREGLARLRHDRHEVIALRVLDRAEVEFPFRSWSLFRGLEGEGARLCEPALARRTYLENFARHRRELEQACAALNVELHAMTTDRPLMDWLITFLKHRRGERGM